MLSELAISGYTLPVPNLLIEVLSTPREGANGTLGRLARFAELTARRRAMLKEQSDRFDTLYRQADTLDVSPDELDKLIEALFARERDVAALLVPRIEKLRENLTTPKANADTPMMRSWRRSAEDALEVSISWLEQYQNLRIRLIKLASDRRSGGEPGSPIFSDADAAIEYLNKLVAE